MKKALLIYHSNIFNHTCGTNVRLYNIIKMLKNIDISTDLFVPRLFDNDWSKIDYNYLSNVYLDVETDNEERKSIKSILERYANKIDHKLRFNSRNNNVEKILSLDWIGDKEKKRFQDILMSNSYDIFIFSYIYYSSLLPFIASDCMRVILLEDFLSIQQLQAGKNEFAQMLEFELREIDRFDRAICISTDEMAFFSNVTGNVKLYYLPHFVERGKLIEKKKDIDIVFVGSSNEHNQRGLIWFLEDVYPRLKEYNFSIAIIGEIVDKIDLAKYSNIISMRHVEKLEDIYSRTKIAISPLQSGTGLKIKIVEALSYGIPVVCTFKSIIGFPNKLENGCIIADEPKIFANAIIELIKDEKLYNEMQKQALRQYEMIFNANRAQESIRNIFQIESKIK